MNCLYSTVRKLYTNIAGYYDLNISGVALGEKGKVGWGWEQNILLDVW